MLFEPLILNASEHACSMMFGTLLARMKPLAYSYGPLIGSFVHRSHVLLMNCVPNGVGNS